MRKLIVFMLLGFFLISMASAEVQSLAVQEINTGVELKQVGADFSFCNITSVSYPNTTIFIEDVVMTKRGTEYNYTIDQGNMTVLGVHIVNGFCSNTTDEVVWAYDFEVTHTGQDLKGSGMAAAVILVGVLLLAFMFMYIGFKMSDNPKLVPLSFFFIILALMLGVYSLNIGWSVSHDIIQYESMSSTAGVFYVTILWLLIGVTIISVALMLIAFIKELGNVAKTKQFGKDFNPITNTYD